MKSELDPPARGGLYFAPFRAGLRGVVRVDSDIVETLFLSLWLHKTEAYVLKRYCRHFIF